MYTLPENKPRLACPCYPISCLRPIVPTNICFDTDDCAEDWQCQHACDDDGGDDFVELVHDLFLILATRQFERIG